ncbi:hypothetical protein ACIA8G_21485 [Lentzea sp. NPDC051213]|uniref:hypothetical protein n=1 Tax=Lentzea sp. NPDC051213 TaxID=3364126 RepID=UPI0037AD277B
MATIRGFVQQIELSRAGLVRADIVDDHAGLTTVAVEDLDADPERFNERLCAVALLRDAMNRAEPVEVEFLEHDERGNVVETVTRLTRDDLSPPTGRIRHVIGLVLGVLVGAVNRTTAGGEGTDGAVITVLSTELEAVQLVLSLQVPERGVALAQLDIVRDAHHAGRVVRFIVLDHGGDERDDVRAEGDEDALFAVAESNRILIVHVEAEDENFGGEAAQDVDGFVEALGTLPSTGVPAGSLATVRLTTAPAFTGTGGTVGATRFSPTELSLLVPKGSNAYQLLEAGLRDNVRVRTRAVELDSGNNDGIEPDQERRASTLIVLGVELLAPLASASRPVWIEIDRSLLDHGPDAVVGCTPGVPSSDLSLQTLRDLRIPYPARWRGRGCFNHGVYRLQLAVEVPARILVDGKPLCLLDSEPDRTVLLGHACLDGDHEIVVEIEEWTCDQAFDFDVYRLR